MGTFAEYLATTEDRVAPMPPSLAMEEAAVLPYAGCVAVQAVVERAPSSSGRSFLVVGASGAVGTIAVQLAKTLGASVTGVCGPTGIEIVQMLGADEVIDYTEVDYASGSRRYGVVLDIGGNTPLSRLRRTLAPDGTLLVIGSEGGSKTFGRIHRQLAANAMSLFVRQTLCAFAATEHVEILDVLTDFVEARGVRPVMGRCYPLGLAPEAIRELEHGSGGPRIAVVP